MQAEYNGTTYFDANGAARYMNCSRSSFQNRKQFIEPSKLPGYKRDFYTKAALDKYPTVKKIETEK